MFPHPSFKCFLLAFALPALSAWAQSDPDAPTPPNTPEQVLPTVQVSASADASAEGLAPAYPGGQMARGGRAGILGTRDALETPFSINSYTAELIQNQQAKSVQDVLQNDATVRTARGFGNFSESYFVRGFTLYGDDIAYNGLYSLLPRQYIAAELFERVEVLHGASAFLTGAAPGNSGIGGSINLLPKRAPNDPLSQINLGWTRGGQTSASFDVARRFGDDQATGLRIVGARREGDTLVDRESSRLDAFLAGFDWRGGKARFSADIGYQNHRLRETRPSVTLQSTVTRVPSAPDNEINYAQPWTYSDERDVFGTARAEYDLSDNVTAWIAGGMRQTDEESALIGINIDDGFTGAGNINFNLNTVREDEVATGEIGLRGKLRTGAVDHALVASYSTFQRDTKSANTYNWTRSVATNLYRPVLAPQPPNDVANGDWHHPKTTSKAILTSFAIGDTLSMLDERLLLTLGIRHQTLETKDYDVNSGDKTNGYKETKNSPMAGLVVRPLRNLSFYANYIESLSIGDTAPYFDPSTGAPTQNAGQALPPYVSKQKEIGVKYEYGTLGVNLALFTTKKPRSFVNAAGYFTDSGNDRHRGVELSVQGRATENLRVFGGVTWLDARQKKTGSELTDGKKVIGVPSRQANLNLEWDVPGMRGLTLDARVIATASSYADARNTLRVPGWSRFDIGARYLTAWQDHLVTLRARIENVTDRDYWASVGGVPNNGYLVLGAPRTFMLTGSLEF